MRTVARALSALLAVGLLACVSIALAGAAGASETAPYSDPSAVGYIGLCDAAGQQITSGSVNATPLAARAVSSVAAPPPYNNGDRTAILLAYQPRQGLPSGEWSGEEMTASSRYSNPAHPMVAATAADDSLENFIQDFPPSWDGFVELRIYLGTEDAETYSVHYPALNLQVTGDTWHAVGGGPVDCHSGTSVSIESILLPKKQTTTPSTLPPGAHGTSTTTTTSAGGTPSTTSGSPAGSSNSGSSSGQGGNLVATTRPSSNVPIVLLVLAALVVGVAAGLLIARRRRPATVGSSSGPPSTSSLSRTERKGIDP